MDSLIYLQEKLSHLQKKYPLSPRYCAFRMVFSSLNSIFILASDRIKKSEKNTLTIVFDIKGGLGDVIIASNYIYHFYTYIKDSKVKLKLQYHSLEILNSICKDLPGEITLTNKKSNAKGDIIVEFNRFPFVLSQSKNVVKIQNPKLKKILGSWKNFLLNNRKFFNFTPQFDGLGNELSEILGNKRISQSDIAGILGINEDFKYKIPIIQEKEVLRKYNLEEKRFITFQRGHSLTEKTSKNNKLWPPEYYDILIKKIKEKYPNFYLVQLGMEKEGFNQDFIGVDLNLRGKTTLEEVKVLLKNSYLHVDSEGGLVHLRHALKGGKSVVLFGPTAPSFYGYSENLNLRSTCCPRPCEWVTNDWLVRCARRSQKNICMHSLNPEFVFEEMRNLLEEGI